MTGWIISSQFVNVGGEGAEPAEDSVMSGVPHDMFVKLLKMYGIGSVLGPTFTLILTKGCRSYHPFLRNSFFPKKWRVEPAPTERCGRTAVSGAVFT